MTMTRANFVKAARKDYPNAGIKKGESYYWWSFRFGGKHMSKTPPKQSQLTQSEFLSTLYDIQERIGDLSADSASDLQSAVEEIADELRTLGEECNDKRDNMPEGLQDGDVGQLLEARAEACEQAASDLEDVDFEVDEDGIREVAKEEMEGDCEDDERATVATDMEEELKGLDEEEQKNLIDERIEEIKEANAEVMKGLDEAVAEKVQERLDEILEEVQSIDIDCE
jgi:hypothetical protein